MAIEYLDMEPSVQVRVLTSLRAERHEQSWWQTTGSSHEQADLQYTILCGSQPGLLCTTLVLL